MNSAIRVEALRKTYGAVVALDGIDLTVEVGECFGLLGPNGAGKTTTLEILEGLLEPTSGEVQIFDRGWRDHAAELRQRIGVTLQETLLSDRLTVGETLALFRSFYRQGADLEGLLASLQLSEKRDAWVSRLSGGQRQRLAVALGVVGEPDLLFLDEPTTGLDPQSRRALWDILQAQQRKGRTLLLTTHYMDEAERLCDRVAVIDHGKVIARGTPRELIEALGGEQVIELDTEPVLPSALFEGLPGVRSASQGPVGEERLTLTTSDPAASLPAVLALVQARHSHLARLSVRAATLEDVFVKLTGRQLRDD